MYFFVFSVSGNWIPRIWMTQFFKFRVLVVMVVVGVPMVSKWLTNLRLSEPRFVKRICQSKLGELKYCVITKVVKYLFFSFRLSSLYMFQYVEYLLFQSLVLIQTKISSTRMGTTLKRRLEILWFILCTFVGRFLWYYSLCSWRRTIVLKNFHTKILLK